jgi:hypothetical protein
MVRDLHLLGLAVRIIRQHQLQRPQHRHGARRAAVEILAHAVLEQADVDDVSPSSPRRRARRSRGSIPACSRAPQPDTVGIRGSSQPLTCFCSTSCSSFRLLMTV